MLVRSVLAAAVAAMVAGQVSAADKVEWNASLWGNPRAVTRGIEAVAGSTLRRRSGGNFTIKIQLRRAPLSAAREENLDGISLGAFEVAQTAAPATTRAKTRVGTALDLPFLPLPSWDALVGSA